jgi:hypothetical protein
VRLTTTTVPAAIRDARYALPVRVVVDVRRAVPYVAVGAGLLLLPVSVALATATVTLGLVELFSDGSPRRGPRWRGTRRRRTPASSARLCGPRPRAW